MNQSISEQIKKEALRRFPPDRWTKMERELFEAGASFRESLGGKEGMKPLLDLLIEHGGSIESTGKLDLMNIQQAQAGGRFWADENGFGFVWMPGGFSDGPFPTTVEEVELFDKWFPLKVELPEDINTFEKLMARERKQSTFFRKDNIREALEQLVHLHMCEQEGLQSGQPTPEMWLQAVDKASKVLSESPMKSEGAGWVSAKELPLKEKSLPDVVITMMENGRVFAYDTHHNLKGLREVLSHHPDILCLCVNKPLPPAPLTEK